MGAKDSFALIAISLLVLMGAAFALPALHPSAWNIDGSDQIARLLNMSWRLHSAWATSHGAANVSGGVGIAQGFVLPSINAPMTGPGSGIGFFMRFRNHKEMNGTFNHSWSGSREKPAPLNEISPGQIFEFPKMDGWKTMHANGSIIR